MTLSTISDTKFQNLIGVTDFANSMTCNQQGCLKQSWQFNIWNKVKFCVGSRKWIVYFLSEGPGSLSSMSSLLPPVISVEQQCFINDMITFCVAKSCQQRKLLQALHFTSFQNLELQESWRNEGSNVRKITSQWELTCLHLIGRFAGRWGWIINPGLIGLSRD